MIPPLAPGQSDEQQSMVGWKNTFNMRQVSLMSLAASNLGAKNGVRSDIKSYIRKGCTTSPSKSLDLLRKNLQSAINKDIDHVIKKYLEKFFQPAINNIRTNQGRDSVTDEHVRDVCRRMLEESKLMYASIDVTSRDSSPYDCSDSDTGQQIVETRFIESVQRKRKESDTDSEASNSTKLTKPKRHRRSVSIDNPANKRLVMKREGPKWDPERITSKTLLIMGAKANKVLGYGQTRGRLYVRHPELVRYAGDQEDKEWLTSKNLMTPSGGKAYIMILEDIQELSFADEYRNNPNLQLNELMGFEAPTFLIQKVKAFVEQSRLDAIKASNDLIDFSLRRSQSITPPENPAIDSAPSTPSDHIPLLESHSSVTTSNSSKQSDHSSSFIHIPEISPGSNNSMLTQSPLSVGNRILSPNMLLNLASNESGGIMVLPSDSGSTLSNILSSHMSSDNSQDF